MFSPIKINLNDNDEVRRKRCFETGYCDHLPVAHFCYCLYFSIVDNWDKCGKVFLTTNPLTSSFRFIVKDFVRSLSSIEICVYTCCIGSSIHVYESLYSNEPTLLWNLVSYDVIYH